MIVAAVVGFVVLVLVLVLVSRAVRRRKARSAVGVGGFAPFVTLTIAEGRDRHRAPARRGWAGSRGAM